MDKPKKFKNAYMQYCVQERAKVRRELHTYDPKRVTRELATRWRQMDPDAKRVFEEASLVDKARWRQEQQLFREQFNR